MKPTLPEGCKVHITHFRRYEETPFYMTRFDASFEGFKVLPTGGATEALILDEENNPLAIGLADCSPRDAFNKKIGRDIAVGRAVKQLKIKEVI
jgi:hypothetical protein